MKITRERILKVVNEEVDRYMSEQEGTSKLYVVRRCSDYGGCKILGVFNDLELAKNAAKTRGQDGIQVMEYPTNEMKAGLVLHDVDDPDDILNHDKGLNISR